MREIEGEGHPVQAVERLIAGDASASEREAAVRHLLAGCDDCRRRLQGRLKSASAEALEFAIDRAAARMDDLARRVTAERAAAAELLARLQTLAPAQQRLFLENSAAAHTRAVCDDLIELAKAQRHSDAHETRRLAELAVLVAERIPVKEAADAPVRAWAELGNAHRICGDLAASGEAMAKAWVSGEEGGVDPLVEAELCSLAASLESYRRDFDRAIAFLGRAVNLTRQFGDKVSLARLLVLLSSIQEKRGEPEKGIPPLQDALQLLRGTSETDLKINAIHNICFLVTEAGAAKIAASLFLEAEPLRELAASPLDVLRSDWLQGKILDGIGDLEKAERILIRVKERYVGMGLSYAAARVSLDLAVIYVRRMKNSELRGLIGEILPVFRSLRIPRETIATLSLLGRVDCEESLVLISQVATAVESARAGRPLELCR
jgi:tetratricopeptide (TPR) repeat protein